MTSTRSFILSLSCLALLPSGCSSSFTPSDPDSGSMPDAASTLDAARIDAARTADAFREFGDAGCASAPTFADVEAAIFSMSCSGPINCHGGGSHLLGGGLALTDPGTYDMLVGVASVADPTIQRVTPGDPALSLLFRKLTNDLPSDGSLGRPMPSGEGILWHEMPADQIELVRCWIATGARR